jgi:hypothetical protein
MPWVEENGLLPGRGAPGRGARGVAPLAAGASGTGLVSAGAGGASEGSGIVTVGDVPFVSAAGAGAGSAGGSATTGAGSEATGTGSATGPVLVAFFAGFAEAAAWARSCSPKFSLSRRTTGGSTVDDADRTNSPMSLSVANTTLLSTPYSLASS